MKNVGYFIADISANLSINDEKYQSFPDWMFLPQVHHITAPLLITPLSHCRSHSAWQALPLRIVHFIGDRS